MSSPRSGVASSRPAARPTGRSGTGRWDRRYTTTAEGYPGLLVHGPLIATLLMDLLGREMPGADVAEFRFRAVRPTFAGATMQVKGQPQADGKTVKLRAQDHAGWLTMDAVATLH
jgi:3-methylfumaryl-CoA hydratase